LLHILNEEMRLFTINRIKSAFHLDETIEDMKQKNIFLALGLLFTAMLTAVGCNGKSSTTTEEAVKPTDQPTEVIAGIDAASLLTTVCYACHNPKSGSHDEMLAPPLAGIKQQYLKATEGREDFVERMAAFVTNPSEDKALMKGPIGRFGLMPKPPVTDEQIKAIVAFIYDNELPAPSWFAEHEEQMHGKGKN
jgi:mono/diheme cytochrome c family protein